MPLSKHSTLPELKEYVRKHPELKIKLSQKKSSLLAALDAKGHIHRGQRTGKITSKNMPKTTPSKIKMSIKPPQNTIDISPIENLMANRDDVEQFMDVLHIMKERNEERMREAPTRTMYIKGTELQSYDNIADSYPSDEEDQSEEAIDKYVEENWDEFMIFNQFFTAGNIWKMTDSWGWGSQRWEADLTLAEIIEFLALIESDDAPVDEFGFDGGPTIYEDDWFEMGVPQIREEF